MRGGFLACSALLGLLAACSGATTRNPHQSAAGADATPGAGATGNLGEAGAFATAGTPGEQPSVDCDCVSQEIGWWREGSSFPTRRESYLAPCNVYRYGEGPMGTTVTPLCTSIIEGCGLAFGIDDVNAALAHPDVQAALERAPVLFGRDPRLIGGQVDHVEVGGKVIEIGYECEPGSSCEIPQGIFSLGFVLGTLSGQETSGGACEVNPP